MTAHSLARAVSDSDSVVAPREWSSSGKPRFFLIAHADTKGASPSLAERVLQTPGPSCVKTKRLASFGMICFHHINQPSTLQPKFRGTEQNYQHCRTTFGQVISIKMSGSKILEGVCPALITPFTADGKVIKPNRSNKKPCLASLVVTNSN